MADTSALLINENAVPRSPDGEQESTFQAAVNYFQDHLEEFLGEYEGRYVAIVKGQVVDSDQDWELLARRMYKGWGHQSIFMPKVERERRVVQVLGYETVRL